MAKEKTPKTNAMRILDKAGCSYRVEQYDCDGENFDGELVANQLDIPNDDVFKTLVLRDDKKDLLVCCIPVTKHLDRKNLAKAASVKSVEMVHVKELQGLTGYIRGGCSPIGMKKALRTYIDESALLAQEIAVSAGQRGLQILINPQDLITQCKAEAGAFAVDES